MAFNAKMPIARQIMLEIKARTNQSSKDVKKSEPTTADMDFTA